MRACYYSKVILFGEYSMIFDSTALMVPLKQFSAQWRFASHLLAQGAVASNASLQRFAEYLSTLDETKDNIDLQRFDKELQLILVDTGTHSDLF